ncbi:MAG: hypothetical protein ACLFR1_05695 [Spirochaetia bacterium]
MKNHSSLNLYSKIDNILKFKSYWRKSKDELIEAYAKDTTSFIPNLLPEFAVKMQFSDSVEILRKKLGTAFETAVSEEYTALDVKQLPSEIDSPVRKKADSSWLKKANMVGINVRTIGNFWNVVKYALTLGDHQDSIHLLPIWDPGVVDSLYGIASWHINNQFFSQDLRFAYPYLDTPEKQLKAVVNVLHALGKTVGMDVIPHTDKYSQITLAFPSYFEWLIRKDTEILDHSDDVYTEAQKRIFEFIAENGPADPNEQTPESVDVFFSDAYPEERRYRVLFGLPEDQEARDGRRNQLVQHLYTYGLEPIAATMGPPYRGMEVDPDPEHEVTDEYGMTWRDYKITQPEAFSRVFNPLARYKLYENKDNNANWEIDFTKPRKEVWDYVCGKYYHMQKTFGFDFMRGDMAHVQMRSGGVPYKKIDRYYDILKAVKQYIREEMGVQYFAYYAETFLAPKNVMGYGEEIAHLEASDADATLGDLQSLVVGHNEFIQKFRQYYDILKTRMCAPNFTIITGDKDDPRFDSFYVKGNITRMFIAFFLTDMPSYMGLGFLQRNIKTSPAPSEEYTKLYVFQQKTGPKVTKGPYRWGKNMAQFNQITRLKLYGDAIFPEIQHKPTKFIIPPDALAFRRYVVWTMDEEEPEYLFIACIDMEHPIDNISIPATGVLKDVKLELDFSVFEEVDDDDHVLQCNGYHHKVHLLLPEECRVYRIVR